MSESPSAPVLNPIWPLIFVQYVRGLVLSREVLAADPTWRTGAYFAVVNVSVIYTSEDGIDMGSLGGQYTVQALNLDSSPLLDSSILRLL